MADFFTLGTEARLIVADTDSPKKIWVNGGTVGRNTSSAVVSTDNSITDGTSYTATASYWYVSASSSKIMVQDLGIPVVASDVTAQDDITVTDDLTVGDALAVTGATALTGALTTTGGIVAASVTPTQVGTWQPVTATSGTDTACSNGTAYVGSVFLPTNKTITGIQYLVGSVGGTTKVVVSLHNYATGAVIKNSATAGTTVGTAAQLQQVAFTSTYAATGPSHYWIALTFDSTNAKFRSVPAYTNAGSGVLGDGVTQTFGTPATFTPPTTFVADKVPVASLY